MNILISWVGIPLMDSGPEFHSVMIWVRNPISTDQESEIQYLEYEIHIVEFRIEDSTGLLNMRSTWKP